MLPSPIRAAILAATLVAASPTNASPTNATETCMAAATTPEAAQACIGLSAAACSRLPKNPTPLDAALCLNDEVNWWQKRLKTALATMQTRAAELDRRNAAAIARGEPSLVDDLAILQTTWKTWSEQRCAFEAMLYRGNPRRMEKASACLLRITAEQALLLESSAHK